ncbi:MAG: phosphatase PAP2 family protein [Puniceicoccales bacterium]|nr:phosphatase PAP2 family protein [Puniceicoccales bacterium]
MSQGKTLKGFKSIFVAGLLAFNCGSRLEASSLENVGHAFQYILPAYAFGLTCLQKDYEGSKQFLYAFGSSQLTVHALKLTTREKRPNYSEGDKKNSFPSGDSSSSFLGAAFIHRRYGFKQAIIPYGFATLNAYSRVEAKKHYVHDVVAGALISWAFVWLFVDPKSNIAVSSDEHMAAKVGYETAF